MTAPNTTYPQDTLARQILTQGYIELPDGSKIANLSGAFGWAGIKPDQISPETLTLAQACGLTSPSAGLWVYESADDLRGKSGGPALSEIQQPVAETPVRAPTPAPAPAPATQTVDVEPPALVLTTAQHAQTRSHLQTLGAEIHKLSDEAKAAFARLIALLHHV